MSTFLHFDEMCWPNPDDPDEVEYTLRYGSPTYEQLLTAASFIAAYRQLVELPGRTRAARVAAIRAGSGGAEVETEPAAPFGSGSGEGQTQT